MKGHIEKRGENTYRICISIGRDEKGKKKYYKETVKGSEGDAELRRAKLLVEYSENGLTYDSNLKLGEYLEDWLETDVKQNLKLRTYKDYKTIVRTHICPMLGHIKLRSLTPMSIKKYYHHKLTSGRADAKQGPLSSSSVKKHDAVFRSALKTAFREGYLNNNPIDKVAPPKVEATKIQTWSKKELCEFLSFTKDTKYYSLWYTLCSTGMRLGEVLGLRWKDCDFADNTISVTQTLTESGRNPIFGKPKTKSSQRTIAIDEHLHSLLKKHKETQNADKELFGNCYNDYNLVFCQSNGNPINDSNLRQRIFYPLIKEAQLTHIVIHALRHTHASILLLNGIASNVIKERLGHSDVSTTLNIYSHVDFSMHINAAESFYKNITPHEDTAKDDPLDSTD